MLKGDLGTTPLAEVLTGLADTEATGCLHVDPADGGDEALVYTKAGQVYSVHVPGRRPQLGARLVSSGALPPEALEEALEAQQTELHGWRLGELLVHLGYVDQSVVSAFVVEQLREATYDLSHWRSGVWKFRKNEKTREDVGGRCTVPELLAEVERRRAEWRRMKATIQGPKAIPVLSSAGMSAVEMTLDQDQWALLCKVDGERDISQLARDCGFTTFEAGQVVHSLVEAGLLEVETAMGAYDHLDDDEDAEDEDAEPMSTADALSSAIAMLGGTRPAPAPPADAAPQPIAEPAPTLDPAPTLEPGPTVEPPAAEGDDLAGLGEWADLLGDIPPVEEGQSELGRLFSFGSSAEAPAAVDLPERSHDTAAEADDALSKVSEALSALLDGGLRPVEPPPVVSLAALAPDEPDPVDPEELAVLERTRAAAAEELARAHAEAERLREEEERSGYGEIEALVASLREQSAPPAAPVETPPPAPVAPVASAPLTRAEIIAAEEEAARLAEEAERAAEAAAARAAAERALLDAAAAPDLAAEAERAAAEEAERVAAAHEAERAAAEEAERIAAAEEADLRAARAAELRAAQEAEQLAAEQAAALAAREAELAAETAAAPPAAPPAYVDDRNAGEREADDRAQAASDRRRDNDTASLLRELSSLGLDDDTRNPPPLPPARPNPPRPAAPPAKDQGKKRKGLFGR